MKKPDYRVNFNALTLILDTFNTFLDELIQFTKSILIVKWKPSEEVLKEYYIRSSKFYFCDKFIMASMFAKRDEIFYLPDDDPRWQAIHSKRQEVVINEDQVVYNQY